MLGREPVLWLGFFRAVIVVSLAFGVPLSSEQEVAIYLLVEAFLSVVARQKVTPVGEDEHGYA